MACGLLALVVYCALQAVTHNGFALDPATWGDLEFPFAFDRLDTAALVLLVLFGAGVFARRRLGDANLVLVLAPVLAVLAGKSAALVAVALFTVASLGVGSALLACFDGRRLDGERDGFQAAAASLFLGLCANGLLVWTALHFPVNYGWTHTLAFGLEILLFRKRLAALVACCRADYAVWRNHGAARVVVFAAVFFTPYVLLAKYGHDELYFHLYLPRYAELYHRYHFDPTIHLWSFNTTVVPMGVYATLFSMADEFAVRMFNLVMNMAAVAALVQFARARFGDRVALLAGLFAVTTPYVLLVTGLVFVDAFSFLGSVLVFVQAFRIVDRPGWKALALFFVLVGFALLCKQLCIVYLVPALCVVAWGLVRERRWRQLAIGVPGGLLLVGAMLAPVLIHNWIYTKNPIFPLKNSYFRSPFYGPKDFDGNRDRLWNHPYDFDVLPDITFHGSRFVENSDFTFGFSYFVFLFFLPVLWFVRNRRGRSVAALALLFLLALYTFVLQKTSGIYVRYFIGSVFVGAILCALIADGVLEFASSSRIGKRIGWLAVGLGFALNAAIQVGALSYVPDYPLTAALRDEQPGHGAKPAYDYASAIYGERGRGLIVDSSQLYFARFHTIGTAWYNYRNFRRMSDAKSADEIYDLVFGVWKADFILMPAEAKFFAPMNTDAFRDRLELKFESGGFRVYEPREAAAK